jgi:predicted nucleic acid-binding protein
MSLSVLGLILEARPRRSWMMRKGQLRIIWNDATRREIERIMRQIPPLRAHGVADLFRSEDRYAAPIHRERFAFIPDPDDRKFAALAQAAGATLVSNDEDLLNHRDRIDVPVLTPGEFRRRRHRTE